MESADELLNLHQLVLIFRRRLRVFCVIALAFFALAVFYTQRQVPMYRAQATVMLNVRPENVTTVKEVTANLDSNNTTVQSEVELLRSRQLAERVVAKLGLDNDPDFNWALTPPQPSLRQRLMAALGRPAPERPTTAPTPEQLAIQHAGVVDAVAGGLEVDRVADTYVINVAFTARSPVKAAKIANAFADRYLTGQVETKTDANKEASDWLGTRLGDMRAEVETAEAAVEQYKIQNNLLSTSGASLTEQEISVYNQNVAAAKADLAEKEARLRTARAQLQNGSTGDDVGEALGSSVIQSLRSQRSQISGRVAELGTRYGPRHPDLLKAQSQLVDVDAQIQAEIRRVMSNLEAQVEVARGRTATVQSSLSGARGALAGTNRASVKLRELERNAEAVRAVYESYLNRYKETTSQQGLERTDGRVVSQAKAPTGPSSPNVKLNLLLGAVLGIGAGLVGVVISEALSSGLANGREVENKLGLAFLASIPSLQSVTKSKMSPPEFVVAHPLSGFAEAFRSLRASVIHKRRDYTNKTLVITSALPAEGKTTLSICLARTAALQGQKVIIVDCDVRRHGLSSWLPFKLQAGLVEVLTGSKTIDEVLLTDRETSATVLPVANNSAPVLDLFDTAEMRQLLADLSERFDLVILDAPPLHAVSDARVLCSMVDAVIIAARWRRTPVAVISAAVDLLDMAGAYIAGVALTRVDMRKQRLYGYGDASYYYKEYARYYAS